MWRNSLIRNYFSFGGFLTHFRHSAPHISEIENQIRWEMSGIERGAQRVREQMQSQDVGDGEAGVKIARRIAPALVDKIREAQRQAADGIAAAKRGKPILWWWLIVLLEPEKLAVITLKGVLSEKPRDFTFNPAVSAAAAIISANAHTQIDYESWKGDEANESEFLTYLRANKVVDAKSFKRYSDRIKRQRMEKWDHKVGISFGAKLIELLTEAAPDWFSVSTNRLKGGRYEAQIVFSEEAKEAIADIWEQTELSRPMLLPMVCPPADWRIAQTTRFTGVDAHSQPLETE